MGCKVFFLDERSGPYERGTGISEDEPRQYAV